MQNKAAWYAFGFLALVVVLFDLFFRFRYEQAGDRLWRIDRISERACLVQIGDANCSPPPADRATLKPARNPYLASPTPEPNLQWPPPRRH
jgi:hypothetical protein